MMPNRHIDEDHRLAEMEQYLAAATAGLPRIGAATVKGALSPSMSAQVDSQPPHSQLQLDSCR